MKKLVYAALALLAFPAWGMAQEEDRLLQLLKSELEYNMDELRKQELPPYYMSLRVNETYRVDLASSFGAMSSSNETEGRTVVPQIRLGNPELDNFKYMNQGIPAGRNGQTPQGAMLPLGDDAVEGIREAIWRETLKRYDYAVDIYNQSKSQAAVSVEDEDKAPCFSEAPAASYYEAPLPAGRQRIDIAAWEKRLDEISAVFKSMPEL